MRHEIIAEKKIKSNEGVPCQCVVPLTDVDCFPFIRLIETLTHLDIAAQLHAETENKMKAKEKQVSKQKIKHTQINNE